MDTTNLSKTVEHIKSAMISIGFSEGEADKQLSELGDVVSLKFVEKVIEAKKGTLNGIIDTSNIEEFIKNNLSPEETIRILQEDITPLVNEYWTEITKDLPREKQSLFFNSIQAIPAE